MTDARKKELDNSMKLKSAAFIYRYARNHGNIPASLTFSQWVERNRFKLYEAVVR